MAAADMSAVEYYKSEYRNDLNMLCESAEWGEELSLAIFLPGKNRTFPNASAAFQRLIEKSRFLICLFFEVLEDQAKHHLGMGDSGPIGASIQTPKLVGILGSRHTNLSPLGLLLVCAVLFSDEEKLIDDMRHLSSFFSDKWFGGRESTTQAQSSLWRVMINELEKDAYQGGSGFFGGKSEPDRVLYKKLLAVSRESFGNDSI